MWEVVGLSAVILEYLYTGLNLESSFRPLKISLVEVAKASRKMSRLIPAMEIVGYAPSCQCSDTFFVWWSNVSSRNFWQPTPNAFRDLFRGCDFAVERAQAPGPETASQVGMTQWDDEGDDGEDESPLIISKERAQAPGPETASQVGMTQWDAKVAEQVATEEEKLVQTQIEVEQETEAVVEPPSSPVETAQAKRVKIFIQKHKTPEVPHPQPVTSKNNERRRKRVQDVDPIGASPTPAVSGASLLAYPKIHELAEKPGSSLHVVLQTVISNCIWFQLTEIEIKKREAIGETVMEATALNSRQASKTSTPPPVAKKTVSMEKYAETTTAVKSPMTQHTLKVTAPQPTTKVSKTQTVLSTHKTTEVTLSVDKGKRVTEGPKRVIPDLASFTQTPVHIQHEVITKSIGLIRENIGQKV
ncbi:hypothetical protein Pyn_16850 [Prunus yedoensis var. nudiflora]|uniref:Uncharacterized protein n=1 Tax=Prunus yedoensis var. nudiflora TaxID=2094558 RepID=A0A314XTL8_PRUYE|nr:hypothetical protein Pyn_16850 [Prunus yedoensis var. nudiflora]